MSTLEYDPVTLPSIVVTRQSGRPKMKRYRPRSKFPDPNDSKIICKKCTERGHNSLTCERRKAFLALQEKMKKRQETQLAASVYTNTETTVETNPPVDSVNTDLIKAMDPGYNKNIL